MFQEASVSSPPLARDQRMTAEEELLKLEKEFAEAIVKNNLEDIADLLQMTGSSLARTEK